MRWGVCCSPYVESVKSGAEKLTHYPVLMPSHSSRGGTLVVLYLSTASFNSPIAMECNLDDIEPIN